MPVTYENARRMALALPGVEEGMAYGTPAFRVAGRFLFRIREDGALAVRIGFEEREALLAADPRTFYLTDHYLNHPAILVRLSAVAPATLREVLEKAWRFCAPKRLLAERDGARPRRKPARRRRKA